MELTEQQIQDRKNDPNNLTNIIHKITGKGQHKNQGRPKDIPNKTNEERALIGLTAHIDTIKNTAEAFNVSPTTVSTYKSGVTSRNALTRSDENSAELKELVSKKLTKLHTSAVDKLMDSLEYLDLENPKQALLYSQIGANVSRIVEKTSQNSESKLGVKVTILTPNQRSIDSYEVIEVGVEN